MKKLLFVLCLFAASANAQELGCFVENGDSDCSINQVQCSRNPNFINENFNAFGPTLGFICNAYTVCLVGQNSRDVKIRKAKSLEARLRKACGSRCRKIK